MASHKIPQTALVVVADGTGARFFRNTGTESRIVLAADHRLEPDHGDHGPAGKCPHESSKQELHEAAFAKQLATDLNRRALAGDFSSLVLIAGPRTLGQIRPLLHKDVQAKLVRTVAKTLTKTSIADVQAILSRNGDQHGNRPRRIRVCARFECDRHADSVTGYVRDGDSFFCSNRCWSLHTMHEREKQNMKFIVAASPFVGSPRDKIPW